MHPTFVKLFIEADADDLTEEDERRRRSRRVKRNGSAMVLRAASVSDRDRRPRVPR
jgi:hypothetical protein